MAEQQEQTPPQEATPAPEAPAEQAVASEQAVAAEGAVTQPVAAPAKAEPAPEPQIPAPPLPPGKLFVWGTGRRKKAVARVRIRPGTGKFTVNKRESHDFFQHEFEREAIIAPLRAAKMLTSWDIWVNVDGGGFTGQAGAVLLGLARALVKAAPESEAALRDMGLLTRDARMKERKKYGQRGARRRFQFSKR
jgi:small subunit ribosomal protein S9